MTASEIARLSAKALGMYLILKAIWMMPVMLNTILHWRHPSAQIESFPLLTAAMAGESALRVALGVLIWYFPDYLMSPAVGRDFPGGNQPRGLARRVLVIGVALIGMVLLVKGVSGAGGFVAVLVAAQKSMQITASDVWNTSAFARNKAVFEMNAVRLVIGLTLLFLANRMAGLLRARQPLQDG